MTAPTEDKPKRARVRGRKAEAAIEMPTAVGRLSSAASFRVRDVDPKKFEAEEWQVEAYAHTVAIGELGYVVSLQADTVSRGQLVVVERDLESGNVVEPEKNEDGEDIIEGDRAVAEKALLALRGPKGGQSAILQAGAVADIVPGEGALIGEPIEDTGQIAWEILSMVEIKRSAEGKLTRKPKAKSSVTSGDAAPLHEDTYFSRYHRSDWMHSDDPTSPLRRVASACREIILLTQLVEATIKSHLSAGIIYVPDEIDFPSDDDEDIDDTSDVHPLTEMLVKQMSAPVEDRRSAAGLVPLIIGGPAEFADAFKKIEVKDTGVDLAWVLNTRNDALGRLATGLDVPPEVMTGKGGLNHWTGANVDKDFIEKHTIPIGDRLARFLTIAFFRRLLMDGESMSEETAERFELAYDASNLLTRADAAKSADSLHGDLILSDDARLEAHGFDPDEVRPSRDEYKRRAVEKIALTPSVNNKPFLPALGIDQDYLVEMGVDPEHAEQILAPATPAQSANSPVGDVAEAGEPGQNEDNRVADVGEEEPVIGEPEQLAVIMERIRATGSAALERALERAASAVINKLPKNSFATKDQIRRLPKTEVLARLSESDWIRMRLTPEGLLKNAWDAFAPMTRMWLRDYYETRGLSYGEADEKARSIATEIVSQLEAQATAAFRQPPRRGRDGLFVSSELVLSAIAG